MHSSSIVGRLTSSPGWRKLVPGQPGAAAGGFPFNHKRRLANLAQQAACGSGQLSSMRSGSSSPGCSRPRQSRQQRLASTALRCAASQQGLGSEGSAYSEEIRAAVEAVRLASRVCKVVQLQLSEQETQSKSDDSPVTVADYAAQAVVAWVLSRNLPGEALSMVGEEDSAELRLESSAAMLQRIASLVNSAVATVPGAEHVTEQQVLDLIDLGASQGGPSGRHWVLDPIDGTRGFVAMRQYAVCLGLLQDGKVVLGVLGCPNMPVSSKLDDDASGPVTADQIQTGAVGVLFAAVQGQGAYTGPLEGEGVPSQCVRVDESPNVGGARFMESYESRHSDHTMTARVAAGVGLAPQPLRVDSQVKYGALSRGDASAFMRFPPSTYREKIWDHAAGDIIVREAGGRISDASGAPLDFSRGQYLELDRGIVAGTPVAHEAILRVLSQQQQQ